MTGIIQPNRGILFMKVGVHAQETLEDIIERKTKEIKDAGFALWGYGGNTCHPATMVQPFVADREARGEKVVLCMNEMVSNHFADPVRAKYYSTDGNDWREVPKAINVLGSRYALAIKELRREELVLPLNRVTVAIGNSRGMSGLKYLRGRVDKACLALGEGVDIPPAPEEATSCIRIDLVAEVCEPYAVFLKN
ncbi:MULTISPECIES: hypothetical protein [unclassified Burkholderia]|uniref:hypothetical protein n=1 Tax=unclassified Burkholderia TaxID=2613784 RepID=UPI00142426F8|nr:MULTISPECIES: hypothetical protein [unclassified Burkholderia]NIE82531.1 hypothetical protein [Burkholderia sp. Tr-860]NIF61308.1 hypothetical protein [Burkholderia sp. Cy-647]NIF94513.1 hypothetical protein [Burkholderia sp. Ax-1720]